MAASLSFNKLLFLSLLAKQIFPFPFHLLTPVTDFVIHLTLSPPHHPVTIPGGHFNILQIPGPHSSWTYSWLVSTLGQHHSPGP